MATFIDQRAGNAASTASMNQSLQQATQMGLSREALYEQKRANAWKEVMEMAQKRAEALQTNYPGITAEDMFKDNNFVDFAEKRAAASGVALFGDANEKQGFLQRVFGSTSRSTGGNRAGLIDAGRAYGSEAGLNYAKDQQMITGTLNEQPVMRQETGEYDNLVKNVLDYTKREPVRPDNGGGGAPAPLPPQEGARTPSPAPTPWATPQLVPSRGELGERVLAQGGPLTQSPRMAQTHDVATAMNQLDIQKRIDAKADELALAEFQAKADATTPRPGPSASVFGGPVDVGTNVIAPPRANPRGESAVAPPGAIPVSEPRNDITPSGAPQELQTLREQYRQRLMTDPEFMAKTFPDLATRAQEIMDFGGRNLPQAAAGTAPVNLEQDPSIAFPQVPLGNEGVGAQAAPAPQGAPTEEELRKFWDYALTEKKKGNPDYAGFTAQNPAAGQAVDSLQRLATERMPQNFNTWRSTLGDTSQAGQAPVQQVAPMQATPVSTGTARVETVAPTPGSNDFNTPMSQLGWKEADTLLVQRFLRKDESLTPQEKHAADGLLAKAQSTLVSSVRDETSRLPRWTPNENVDPELVRQVDNYMKVSDPNGPYTKAMRDDPRFSYLLETTASQASKTRDATIKKLYADGELTMAQARAIAQAGDAVESLSALEYMSKNSKAFETLINYRTEIARPLQEAYQTRIAKAATEAERSKLTNDMIADINRYPQIKSLDERLFTTMGSYLGSGMSEQTREFIRKGFFGNRSVAESDYSMPAFAPEGTPGGGAMSVDPESFVNSIMQMLGNNQ
jgi:hypothetical protein